MYRRQRHIYNATRRYYLLGRDQLIAGLQPAARDSILETGEC
jgi:S-adenosylmethionine-diacylgycerolhomoserine-N-methlytransferase